MIKFIKMKEFIVIEWHEPLNFFEHLQFVHGWKIIIWLRQQHLLYNLLFVFEYICSQVWILLKLTVKITEYSLRTHLQPTGCIALFENNSYYFLQKSLSLFIRLLKPVKYSVLGGKNQ